ncbi:transcriptional regulator [Frankia torreyi]|uniref:Transcriptional regulator n=1 Tax=Frankia torreyi TaxID=1856 RepID=A0A0D8BD53_9ACTN|nr:MULTISPECIES: LysR family transcriptional regulator [Frankia]KJE21995.1 transcriptional regulator [Frankia torreyi]KQM04007.1 transcriptional regulator [Frankia sp. CpI1-P]
MIDVRRLRILRELDSRGTVVATAAALHLTPSAVSQQLAALAKETGVRLLDPAGRRVRLTPAARVLLGHADVLFAQLERAEADLAAFNEGRVGSVAVAAFTTAISGIVVPALAALRESRPRLRMSVSDVAEPACFDLLLAGDLDLAVSITHPGAQPLDERLLPIPLLDDPLDVALPAGHPYAAAAAVPLEVLGGEDFISSRAGTPCHEVTHAACAAAGFVPRVRHRCDDYTAVLDLIAAGCGVGLIPRLAKLASTPQVALRPIAGVPPIRPIFAAVRRGSQQAPHLSATLAAIVAAARSPDLYHAFPQGRRRGADPVGLQAGVSDRLDLIDDQVVQ